MHGCYNSIGLWFLQGVAGITVDATNSRYPLTVRAGVDSGDITSATGSRFALHGMATSSWSSKASPSAFVHNITLTGNTEAGFRPGRDVVLPPSHRLKSGPDEEVDQCCRDEILNIIDHSGTASKIYFLS